MNKANIDIARELLFKWMACGERKHSYEAIRKNCEYIDRAYELGLNGNAVWTLFQPLFRTGVVEFAGKDCYALCPTVAVEHKGHFIYNGILPQKEAHRTAFTGIYKTDNFDDVEGMKIVHFDAETILKHIPSVREVVDSFPISIEDLTHAEYYHYKGAKGLTKRLGDGAVRYFCIPEQSYQREVPGQAVNPDAFCIAYNNSRSLNGDCAGKYDNRNQVLRMYSFGLPASIERILFLESMALGNTPEDVDRTKLFPSIKPNVVKQLNRILCNTIEYE
ncbi:MAG: hypothetical protein NC250_08435 [Alistipes senegalensis]|nr:hypothetical protein [Bacteroides cellulosilyticus]MCM1352744.1 hypothetical protein [Alistipes senegalensis]